MRKRSSYTIVENLLLRVREKPATYAELERGLGTNNLTVKSHVDFLRDAKFITIMHHDRHPSNGRPYDVIAITKEGVDFLRRRKKA